MIKKQPYSTEEQAITYLREKYPDFEITLDKIQVKQGEFFTGSYAQVYPVSYVEKNAALKKYLCQPRIYEMCISEFEFLLTCT